MHVGDRGVTIGCERVQPIQRFRAGVVEPGDGEHGCARGERRCGGHDKREAQGAVGGRLGAAGPDPGCGEGGAGEQWGHDVDDEPPFFVRLQAVGGDEGEVGEQEVCGRGAEDGVCEGEGDVEGVGDRVEEEPGEGGGEVEVPGGGTPVCGPGLQDVVFKSGELGPERGLLPEKGVDGDREAQAEDEAYSAREDNCRKGEAATK